MFVCSVKTSRKTLAVGLACLVVFLVLTAAVIWWPDSADTVETVAAATQEEQLAFLRSIGCEAAAQPMTVEEVLIPDEPDETFNAYNELQKQAGFDLADYHGKRVKRWTYMATCNDTATVANLYVYRNVLVGGDLTDPTTGEQRALMAHIVQEE